MWNSLSEITCSQKASTWKISEYTQNIESVFCFFGRLVIFRVVFCLFVFVFFWGELSGPVQQSSLFSDLLWPPPFHLLCLYNELFSMCLLVDTVQDVIVLHSIERHWTFFGNIRCLMMNTVIYDTRITERCDFGTIIIDNIQYTKWYEFAVGQNDIHSQWENTNYRFVATSRDFSWKDLIFSGTTHVVATRGSSWNFEVTWRVSHRGSQSVRRLFLVLKTIQWRKKILVVVVV